MNDCHSQAVRASRAMLLSEKRRNSPLSGDSTSPTLEPLPGKRTPLSRVCKVRCENAGFMILRDAAVNADLDEELSIELAGGRVEGRARDGGVNLVLGRNRVRREEVDDLDRGEAGVAHAREDLVVGVRRLGNEQIRRRLGDVRAPDEELQARSTSAVRDTDGTSELDATRRDRASELVTLLKRVWAYKSPKVTLCLSAKGRCASTISSTPMLASVGL